MEPAYSAFSYRRSVMWWVSLRSTHPVLEKEAQDCSMWFAVDDNIHRERG